jgi:T5SS/PEP-CTERM-associated repeat protein
MLRKVLGCALCAALWLIVAAVGRAAITQEGGVSISAGTVQVGLSLPQQPNQPTGDGKLWVTSPSTLAANTFNIGSLPSGTIASGALYVQGGTITSTEGIYVGRGGNGRLEVTGGGQALGGFVRIGGDQQSNPQFSPQGVALIDGVGSKLRYSNLSVGASSDGQLYVTGGGTILSGPTPATTLATIGSSTGSTGLAVVDGAGSLWQHSGDINVGQGGPGSLRVTGGGVVISTSGRVGGEAQNAFGSVVIDGPGSRWSVGNLLLGNQSPASTGEVLVTNGGMLDQGGTSTQFRATVGQGGFGRVVVSGPTSRWLHPGTPLVGSPNGGMGEIVLENGTQFTSAGADLQSGRVLVDGPTTRWNSTGPIIFGNSPVNAQTIELRNGATLNMPLSASLTISPNGRLLLTGGRLLAFSSRGSLTNNGLIQGGGLIQAGPVTNNGRILVGAGERLQISGQFVTNGPNAVVEVNNGELELGPFTSTAGSRLIASGATLRGVSTSPTLVPWQGKGAITFAAGRNRVFGAYNHGTTVVASGAEVEFYDALSSGVVGVISVSAGAKLTAFGPFRGTGAGGGGSVFLENVIQPGNTSTGVMAFGGDVQLGGVSQLEIQVGGPAPAADYDVLVTQGDISLSGALRLTAVGELNSPTALLPIVEAGELSGVFSSIPAIGANIGAGVRFHGVTYDYANDEVLVSLTQGLPADFNLDGAVSGTDFLVWQRTLGSACEPGMGADATCDGLVDGADLAVWQAAIAAANGVQTGVQTAVPEPASLGLVLLALGAAVRPGVDARRRHLTTA